MNANRGFRDRVDLHYVQYSHDKEPKYLSRMRELISKDLSEPYSIYVYRYFLGEWVDLCFLALNKDDDLIGVVICKLERQYGGGQLRGYIAMLVVLEEYRGKGVATKLVKLAIDAMIAKDADEICLETEVINVAAMKLYERLGFIKSKRLHRYYLNGNSAFRFLLPLKERTVSPKWDNHWNEHVLPPQLPPT